jgi:hypothetical protein
MSETSISPIGGATGGSENRPIKAGERQVANTGT